MIPTVPEQSADRPNPISQGKRLFFFGLAFFLMTALIGLVLEITFRILYVRDQAYDWLSWHPTCLYVNNSDLPDVYWDTEWNVNSLGLRGPEIGPKTKPRILCLGSSSTFGYKVDFEECYPSVLQRMLPQYEVINGGVFGYSSYQGLQLLKWLMDRVRPDAVTVDFGYNDRRYVVRPEWADGPESFRFFYRQYSLHTRLCTSRVYEVLTKQRFQNRFSLQPPVTALVPRVNTLHFRQNLEEILSLCQEKAISAVLIGLGDHPDFFRDAEAGVDALRRGEHDRALELFRQARETGSEDAKVIATYYLAFLLQLTGHFEEADEIAGDYSFSYYFPGVNPIRTTHSYFKVLSDLSAEHETPLLFFRDLIDDDSRFYLDECHPTAEGDSILGSALADVFRQSSMHKASPNDQSTQTVARPQDPSP